MNHSTEKQTHLPTSERLNPSSVTTVLPANVDLFLSGSGSKLSLSEEITGNQRLVEMAKERRFLYESVGKLFRQETEDEKILEEEIVETYDHLGEFIQADTNHTRIILYLPFEMVPDLKSQRDRSVKLKEAEDKFADIYKSAWIRLLFESETRANFNDGDVLEPSLGEPPLVRKAAHLVPELLRKGIINSTDLINLLETKQDDELLESLGEGIVESFNKSLLSEAEYYNIGLALGNIKDNIFFKKTGKEEVEEVADLEAAIAEIEERYKKGSDYVANFSENRIKWEKETKKEEVTSKYIDRLVVGVMEKQEKLEDIEPVSIRLRTIFKVGEEVVNENREKATELAKTYVSLIENEWNGGLTETKDIIFSGLSHWKKLDIVPDGVVERLGIEIPDFLSVNPINFEKIISRDFDYLKQAAEKIKNHSTLSEYIYPLFLIYGSIAKGQGRPSTDHDIQMFIKPNTPYEKREEILQLLHQEVPEVNKTGGVFEAWTKEENGKISYRQIENRAKNVADPSQQIYVVLGGVWVGDKDDISKIQGDILNRYLDLSRFGEQKDELRFYLLRQIESDVLQFRLMHKGYRYFYPQQSDKKTEYSDLVDGKSDFWDPMYRRIATQLFLSKVFLPDLSETGK